MDIDLRVFGGSALTADIDVPKADSADDLGDAIPVTYDPIPITYVSARNTVFLSFALASRCSVPAMCSWRQRLGPT